MSVSVLFVCLGNICRSPTAQAVFERLVADNNLSGQIRVDSAGTAGWHSGKQPDVRSIAAGAQQGYDLTGLRARQVAAEDFQQFDYIVAMDKENLKALKEQCPAEFSGELRLLLSFTGLEDQNVPDPYYGGDSGFQQVIALTELAGAGLLSHIIQQQQFGT